MVEIVDSVYVQGWRGGIGLSLIECRLYKYVLFRFFAYFFSLTWVNKGKSVGVNYSNKKHEKNDIG